MKFERLYSPFIKTKDNVWNVMSDVLLALVPCAVMAYFAFGFAPFLVMMTAVASAVLTEFVFSLLLLKRKDTLKDGSALVTAILLSFTLAPFTPWYIVAFGAAAAVLFGKILWGGLGRNIFNPALVGREFMTIFFPTVMTSSAIWYNKEYVNLKEIAIFGESGSSALVDYLNTLFFKASGAIGEYSAVFLILGAVFLLLRRRISWHIPLGLFVAFALVLQGYNLLFDTELKFSIGGVLLGAVFMATDMPSSPISKTGKFYYGAMIGLSAALMIIMGIRNEYMSYSILLLNGFALLINKPFAPRVWGTKTNVLKKALQIFVLTLGIIASSIAVVYLHEFDLIQYLVYGFIVFICIRFFYLKNDKSIKV